MKKTQTNSVANEAHIFQVFNITEIFLMGRYYFHFKEEKINELFIQPWRHSNIFFLDEQLISSPFWMNFFIPKSIEWSDAYIKYRCRFSLILTSPSSTHFISAYFMVKETIVFLLYPSKLERESKERWHEEWKSFVSFVS